MKLKKLAAALAFAAVGAPAMAAIDTTSNGAELFFVVWDETAGSYTKDLGISLNSFIAGGPINFSASVLGTAFSQYTASDTNLADGSPIDLLGTRWGIFAVDTEGIGPNEIRYLTSATLGTSPTPNMPGNGDFVTVANQIGGGFLGTVNQSGTHATTANGESFNAAGTAGALDETVAFGIYSVTAGNVIGASGVQMFSYVNSSVGNLGAPPTASGPFAALASFNGSTLQISAVPETNSIALLLAGLSAFGFVGRRLKRD